MANTPLPSEYGFDAAYVPARADKVAPYWKRQTEDPTVDTSQRPNTPAYAVVPGLGMAVLDMDTAKDANTVDGWVTLNHDLGKYGTDPFPKTYLVGTPSGGVHAYYAIPAELVACLKNSVHPSGVAVDIRCEGKGYVIGAGSRTAAGEYQLLDLPDDHCVPYMSSQMVAWLKAHDYVKGVRPPSPRVGRSRANLDTVLHTAQGQPDMTPIPEGERNRRLYEWTFGRLKNHPENAGQIHAEHIERGRASGLPDREITTIWNSVMKGTQS